MKKIKTLRDLIHKAYLHGSEVEGDLVVTMKEFYQIEVYSKQEKGMEELGVVSFNEDVKPLILTGRKIEAIERAHGTGDLEKLIGKQITLHTIKERHFGKDFDVITVKPIKPTPKKLPSLKKDKKKWDGAVKSLREGVVTVEQILQAYSLTEQETKELRIIQKK